MRIAAGVLLIIVGIMNGLAGFGYAAVGGASAVAQDAAKNAAANPANTEMTDEQKKALADAATATANVNSGGLATLGIFLLVMLGLQIAGAVTLFMSKAAMFVLIVGVLGLAAEAAGPLAFGVAFGVTNIVGVVASLLAIIASRGYANKAMA